jgi:hypothetical protein
MHAKTRRDSDHLSLLTALDSARPSGRRRADVENFIRQTFAACYGADIRQFMPILLCLKDQSARPRAALGIRHAANTPLFLEHYLERPVEEMLSAAFHESVSRTGIVEVGNLAISDRGAARSLIVAMTAFLCAANYQWVVFTIGPLLINSFIRLGLPLTDLGPATIERLPNDEYAAWGSYYEQKPRVMAGRLADAHELLARYGLQEHALRILWQRAQHVGRKAA